MCALTELFRIFVLMKKVVAILTLILYFSLSAIQAISLHYCHGELESLYLTSERSTCCADVHTDHATCCKDITIEVDFDTDHLVSETPGVHDSFDAIHTLYCLFTPYNTDIEKDPLVELDTSDKLPPPKIYCLQHSFLFYG